MKTIKCASCEISIFYEEDKLTPIDETAKILVCPGCGQQIIIMEDFECKK